jgi:Domain of unknown function (DUF4136)
MFQLALVAALAILLSACSTTPKVSTQATPGADFTRYHTFALVPLPTTGPVNDPGLMLRVGQPARQAVVETLVARGLAEVDLKQADLAVNLRGQFLPKVEVTDLGYRAAPVYGRRGRPVGMVGYNDVEVRNFEERTLNVEIFDNRSKEMIWVGWCKSEASGEVKAERVQEVIRKILSKFPANSSASTP